MEQTFEKVLAAVQGKIGAENGVALYNSVAEFVGATGHDSVEDLSTWKDMELTDEFTGAFIAYDYQNTDFMFLTDASKVDTFIARILAE